eukprot:330159-Rhodomonas_salina.3
MSLTAEFTAQADSPAATKDAVIGLIQRSLEAAAPVPEPELQREDVHQFAAPASEPLQVGPSTYYNEEIEPDSSHYSLSPDTALPLPQQSVPTTPLRASRPQEPATPTTPPCAADPPSPPTLSLPTRPGMTLQSGRVTDTAHQSAPSPQVPP